MIYSLSATHLLHHLSKANSKKETLPPPAALPFKSIPPFYIDFRVKRQDFRLPSAFAYRCCCDVELVYYLQAPLSRRSCSVPTTSKKRQDVRDTVTCVNRRQIPVRSYNQAFLGGVVFVRYLSPRINTKPRKSDRTNFRRRVCRRLSFHETADHVRLFFSCPTFNPYAYSPEKRARRRIS